MLPVTSRIRANRSPACTVVVPTYNRRLLLRRTLSRLSCQTLAAEDFEVIVVDDGSSDGSEEVVYEFSDTLEIRYLWQRDDGFRVAAARNLGLRHARGEFVVFLDSGVLPHSSCIEAHLAVHKIRPTTAVVGYVYCFDGQSQPHEDLYAELSETVDIDQYCLECAARPERLDAREPLYGACRDELGTLDAPWVVFWTCNVSARVDDLLRIGGFDENFRGWGGEDIELGYRLLHSGVSLQLARSATAVHHPHSSDLIEKRRTALANFRYFARKHGISIQDALMSSIWQSILRQ